MAVLAGGASRRFNADKALVELCPGGGTLLESVIELGRGIADEVFVVGHARYASQTSDTEIVPDDHPGEGPLAAIDTALSHSTAERLLVLGCDMPCLSPSLLRWMASIETDFDVLMPRTSDGRWHPMPAIYRRSAIPAIEQSFHAGARSIVSILSGVSVQEITEFELRRFDPDLSSLFSLNRQEQLERARRCVKCK